MRCWQWRYEKKSTRLLKETAALPRAQWSDRRCEKLKFRTSPLLVFASFCPFLMIFWSTFCITKCLFSASQNHHFRMVFAMNSEQWFCWHAKTHAQFSIRRDVIECKVMWCYVTFRLCYVKSSWIMLSLAMLCYVMFYSAMLCYAMVCCVMLCCVTVGYAMQAI